ncbi:hypothetical protein TsFJ059_005259 [Trichoderma semiorbis]|uniref:Uncharacterized protein n=1 Tax=Trichoderma semiorbis TaxID=1491008 RepID=A0A9P8HZJ2_9HYPO|nr:hypothetical protein TsFJ059_005259 [Trichoderma semiorbis]
MSYGAQHSPAASHRIASVPCRLVLAEIKPTLRFLAEDGRRLEACTHVHACTWTGRPGTHHTRLQGFLQGCSRASFRAFLSCPRRSQAAAGWGAPRGQPGQSAGVSAMLLVLIASCSLASPPASIDFESPRISLLPTRRTVSSPSLCLSRCCASAKSAFVCSLGRRQNLDRCGACAHHVAVPQNPVPARSLPVDGPRFRAQAGFKVQGPPRLEAVETRLAVKSGFPCRKKPPSPSPVQLTLIKCLQISSPKALRRLLAPCFNSSRPCLVPVRLLYFTCATALRFARRLCSSTVPCLCRRC